MDKGKERIKQFVNYKGITINAFEKMCGLTRGQVHNTKRISQLICEKILARFPEISVSWLLTGTGEMLNDNETTVIDASMTRVSGAGNITNGNNNTTNCNGSQTELIDSLKQENQSLKKENAELRKQNSELLQSNTELTKAHATLSKAYTDLTIKMLS